MIDIAHLQVEAYCQMSGEERLKIGLGLYEASLAIAREAICDRYPNASEVEISEKLKARIRAGYDIDASAGKTS